MHARITARLAAIAVVALAPVWVAAEEAKKPIPPNPVGAGGTWTQTVNKEAAIAGEEFDELTSSALSRVVHRCKSEIILRIHIGAALQKKLHRVEGIAFAALGVRILVCRQWSAQSCRHHQRR